MCLFPVALPIFLMFVVVLVVLVVLVADAVAVAVVGVVVVVVVANPCLCLFFVCVVIIVRKVDFLLFVYARLSNKSHVAVVMIMITASMIHTPFWLLDILNGSNFLIGTNLPNVKWIEMELVNRLDKF